jgi:hypothetical protein
MSHFCTVHPRYEAKRAPNSICGKCWQLFFYKNPELKIGAIDTYDTYTKQAFKRELQEGQCNQ